ncbi:TPA: hypothetical protein QDC20_006443 [Burkholderia aenigmatica]|uniref:hypothetical protein n=1 Tax=Burkholderia sp. AU45251 TaxID=3059204 RepID=UPI00264D8C75|nr:hypothetical protein [Burkholderia sp. AU45251]HDR9486044.1 hypothetical protein [Burkholderia aenigmatica]MDN7518765.1 hypothetical protein [Burkholderia sp. AU45251]HDR9517760.1 hypothetical protein [Burkholderia aenigmatica]HDR9595949.1 hypothetical protein [Burkholderia aenigmatica]HDR9602998.1 hypothetical protein [Burkholderia aenigmatica]
MNDQRKKNPVRNVSILIVVAVLLVIGTILYNAISQKHAYDEAHPAEAGERGVALTCRCAARGPRTCGDVKGMNPRLLRRRMPRGAGEEAGA